MYENGAHDGFHHEAIGDTVLLSMTPGYLAKVGLLKQAQPSREAVLNDQMRIAADKIAFLPFGKLIDQWRWGVFSGKIKPEDYNKAWWQLREQVQGVAAPVARTEEDFDPGAKYHVPGKHALHTLFPVLRHPVPVPSRAVPGGGIQGPAA